MENGKPRKRPWRRNIPDPTLWERIGGALLALLMFFTSYLGSVFLMGPLLWIFFVDLTAFTHVMSVLVAAWMEFTMCCFHLLTNARVRIFGEALRRDESFMVIMNHRTRLDWIFWWVYLRSIDCLTDMKIILKDELNKIPGAGWAMQNAAFVFIKRRWETDRMSIAKFTRHFARCTRHTKYLLFPEGTDYCPLSKPRSDAYALKSNLPRLHYVLHPRTTGFVYLCSLLRDQNRLDAIYDFTVAYPSGRSLIVDSTGLPTKSESNSNSNSKTDANSNVQRNEMDAIDACHLDAPIPHTELEVLCGSTPSEVRYYIRRFDATELPVDDESLANWLTERWNRKEIFLRRFYREPTAFDADADADADGHPAREPIFESRVNVRTLLIFTIWCGFLAAVTYLLTIYSFARWYLLAMTIFYLVISFCLGGMHKLIVDRSCQQLELGHTAKTE